MNCFNYLINLWIES